MRIIVMQNKLGKLERVAALLLSFSLMVWFVTMPGIIVTTLAAEANELVILINSFEHGGDGTLTATAQGDTVTVTGTVTGARNSLVLDIDADVTVEWEADYRGSISSQLISVVGAGTFVVLGDGVVSTTQNTAICTAFGSSATVIVKDNAVVSGPKAIEADGRNSKVQVMGGRVSCSTTSSTMGFGAIVSAFEITVEISGGLVETPGLGASSYAVLTGGGSVSVTGGFVKSVNAAAIHAGGNNLTTISGGLVFSHGTTLEDVIFGINESAVSGEGMVVAWDKTAYDTKANAQNSTFSYSEGDNEDLTWFPAGGSTVGWETVGDVAGFSYENGGNTGHIAIPVRIGALTFDISVDAPAMSVLPTLTKGYNINVMTDYLQYALPVTVTNTGNMPTGNLTITATGDDFAFDFPDSVGSIQVGGDGEVAVIPKNKLEPGTYEVTITIVGTNIDEPQSFSVEFTVNAPPENSRAVTVEMWDDYGDGWNGSELRVVVNSGKTYHLAADPSGGKGPFYFDFYAMAEDNVKLYWQTTSESWDYEVAYAVYYKDTPPAVSFEWENDGNVLSYREYGHQNDARQWDEDLLDEFTVEGLIPDVT
ncbi:MAG: hypothetical protein FWH07_08585, partial [Oscillospiraceae bacterium]|nr:hypothetical protein [Oscillospiraceae bacterium]